MISKIILINMKCKSMSTMIKEITITPILASFCVVVASIDIKFYSNPNVKPQIFWRHFTHFKMSCIILNIYLRLSIKESCMDFISSFIFCISFIDFSMTYKWTSINSQTMPIIIDVPIHCLSIIQATPQFKNKSKYGDTLQPTWMIGMKFE